MESPAEFRDFAALKREKFNDERISTITSREQINTEHLIEKCFDRFEQLKCLDQSLPYFYRDQHIRYLENALRYLSSSYECLDSSRPWLVYWILNPAHLLNFKFSDELLDNVVDFLEKCRAPTGGFGGGPGQYAHLAPTYAAVNSLCIIGTERAYEAINRKTLKQFLLSVRDPDGAFRLHVDGETDVRGAYCALSCAKLVNFSEEEEKEVFRGTADWVASCQTYEGGFGGAPDLEAHGGYTFCGIASLVFLGCTDKCNLDRLLKWTASRQMRFEGGFQGRTNKLVDGCYSFWVGAIFPIVKAILMKNDPAASEILQNHLLNSEALQEYILLCCQKPNGGLIDKPGKPQDLYHTCYTLSGVSVAQHCSSYLQPYVLGNPENELLPVHPLHNVPPMSVINCIKYFQKCSFYDDEMSSDKSDETNNSKPSS
ncbi:unnamed protein product [Hermetia illucens]|uniref:Protein farnesyltransferase subunit beta n=1 Tax=Hermetia illucens TaxID=343691 RepID=A0A7R8Z0M6_HERIL|nr:protein farnesyltransferase subunit beta [Hermetia illucens]CAD7092769.1 unnamed protein product [Hermetia illucens]